MSNEDKKKEKKTMYHEKETIVKNEDGTFDSHIQEFTRVVERDKFIQVYLEDMKGLLNLTSKTDIRVLISIWEKAQYNSNKIILIKAIKEDIAKEVGYSYQVVVNSISKLSKMDLLLREDTSVYYLNPKFFFKGSHKNRKDCFEFLIKYKLID